MADTLSAVWQQVTDLLAAGVSIIPVRDREQEGRPAKSPYSQWKEFQSRIVTEQELWHAMEEHGTTAIAIVCGSVSGNLEAIDIDVKNWPGIDALLFESIRTIYPSLWMRLRIHSTPSGGFHILYRTSTPTNIGNQKLATASASTQAGIETRGEGGYIVAPPSLGYQVYQDRPIPVISLELRESLINLARSFNEKIKIVAPPTIEKHENNYYDENPFEAYNHSTAAEQLLSDYDWTHAGGNNLYQYFTRPGKSNGISASFNRQTRLYYIFTTSTGLDAERGYHPATLLAHLRFNGDKRATYRYLVDQGYGRIKPVIERAIVKAKAVTGEELPANISQEAKVIYLEQRTEIQQRYPHGVFWEVSDKGGISINRERIYAVSGNLGFRSYLGQVVKIDNYIVKRIPEREYYDALKAYIGADEDTCNAFEAFLQRAGEFTISRIATLDTSVLLASTKFTSYKFYQNGVVTIDAERVTVTPYALVRNCLIWESQLLPRDFEINGIDAAGLYYQFLDLAIGVSDYLYRAIGYLAHEHKDEANAYMIMLTEQCPNPKQGGGTGKNIFTNLIGCATTLKNVAGSQVQLNEKFLQVWNYERVMAVHDLPKKFNLAFFKELSSGSGTLKKLFHDEQSLPASIMPKYIFTTNFSYDDADGGIRRRLIPIEFTSFFTRSGGVDLHFGKMFPYDWTPEDWVQYDNIIVHAIQVYLAHGGKLEPNPLTEDGWLKQFDQMHMQLTREFIQQHWDYWLREGFISNDKFKENYTKFSVENNIDRRYQLSSMRMTQALEDWCNHYQVVFLNNYMKRDLLDTIRGRLFQKVEAPF
jgi:bifunctional DNA primase/polymerase-like protein